LENGTARRNEKRGDPNRTRPFSIFGGNAHNGLKRRFASTAFYFYFCFLFFVFDRAPGRFQTCDTRAAAFPS